MVVVLVPNATIPPAPGTREEAHAVVDRLADLDPVRFQAGTATEAPGGDG
jgi:hypothetical protein